jgi:uronate dehydrogenase
VYGVSANRDNWWDLGPARALGYDPRDDAAVYDADVLHRPEDDAESAFVGGPFVDPGFDVAPFPSPARRRNAEEAR